MKKQLLIVLMVTIVLATVFVAGCTGDYKYDKHFARNISYYYNSKSDVEPIAQPQMDSSAYSNAY